MFDFWRKSSGKDNCLLSDGVVELRLNRVSNNQYMYYIYLCETGQLIGYSDLRVGHSLSLYYYGNVGYRIRPEFRGHGYAYRASMLLIDLARKLNMGYVIFTVSPDNIASVKTCQKICGECREVVNVPSWHPLYISNEKIKMIFRYDLG